MSETVTIELVGAKTYATVQDTYRADQPYEVAASLWGVLKGEIHPVNEKVLFALWTERPETPETAAEVVSDGLDTGGTLTNVDASTPDGADLSDLEEAPISAPPALEETKRKITLGRKSSDAVQV